MGTREPRTRLRAIERRSKLLGLDAPARRELSGPGGVPLGAPMGLEVVFVEADGTRTRSRAPANDASTS